MNQKTAKLLNRYAAEVGTNYKEVRRVWEDANQKERAKMRVSMRHLLRESDKPEQEGAE